MEMGKQSTTSEDDQSRIDNNSDDDDEVFRHCNWIIIIISIMIGRLGKQILWSWENSVLLPRMIKVVLTRTVMMRYLDIVM